VRSFRETWEERGLKSRSPKLGNEGLLAVKEGQERGTSSKKAEKRGKRTGEEEGGSWGPPSKNDTQGENKKSRKKKKRGRAPSVKEKKENIPPDASTFKTPLGQGKVLSG